MNIYRSTGNQARSFAYDSSQRLQSASSPENGTITYAYNADSTLQQKTYNNGNYEYYTYDAYQRLIKIQRFVCPTPSSCSEDTTERVAYTFDALNGVPYAGLLTQASFASGLGPNSWSLANQFTYTALGQLKTKTLVATAGTKTGSLTTTYGYDQLGGLTSIQYPGRTTFTYSLDGMERQTGLVDSTGYSWASNVQFDAASHMTQATLPGGSETWTFNTLGQITSAQAVNGASQMMYTSYSYNAGSNNGQIASVADMVTHETIAYGYDSLKRLVSAVSNRSGSPWSESYTFDGFGNLYGMTQSGGAPRLSVSVNASTNQIEPINVQYDYNGNVTQFGPTESQTNLTYDVVNRLSTVNASSAYAYDDHNRRVYFRNSGGAETLYLFGLGDKKLATYTVGLTGGNVAFTPQSQNVYFAGKLISAEGNAVAVDALGSVRWNASVGTHGYYPYGVEYTSSTSDTEKYATYTRDSVSGLDYAMNRYCFSPWGRFITPDPSDNNIELRSPQSWNRYMYTLGDPIAGSDPTGLDDGDNDNEGTANEATVYMSVTPSNSLFLGAEVNGVTVTDNITYSLNSAPAYPSSGDLVLAMSYDGNTEIMLDPTTYLVGTLSAGVFGAGFATGLDEAATGLIVGTSPEAPEAVATSFFDGTTVSDSVISKTVDPFHNFPSSVEAFEDAGQVTTWIGDDGTPYTGLNIPGSYPSPNGTWYDGTFQFIKNSGGTITHRAFIPWVTGHEGRRLY